MAIGKKEKGKRKREEDMLTNEDIREDRREEQRRRRTRRCTRRERGGWRNAR